MPACFLPQNFDPQPRGFLESLRVWKSWPPMAAQSSMGGRRVSTFMEMSDKDLFAYVTRSGLGATYEPADPRRQVASGLWPGEKMTPQSLKQSVAKLQDILCTDTYGGVDAVRYARDAYNSRLEA